MKRVTKRLLALGSVVVLSLASDPVHAGEAQDSGPIALDAWAAIPSDELESHAGGAEVFSVNIDDVLMNNTVTTATAVGNVLSNVDTGHAFNNTMSDARGMNLMAVNTGVLTMSASWNVNIILGSQ